MLDSLQSSSYTVGDATEKMLQAGKAQKGFFCCCFWMTVEMDLLKHSSLQLFHLQTGRLCRAEKKWEVHD